MQEIVEILEEIGLSEKEVIVYRALLQLGEETASRISEIADLNRVTTYTLLKSLKEKGFCAVFDKNNIQFFRPIKPENILSLLEDKRNKVKSIIPILKKEEKNIETKLEISLFEGKKGITTMFDIILKDAERKKEVFAYGNLTIAEKTIEYQSLHWRKTRLDKKIEIKALVDNSKSFKEQKQWKELTEIRTNKDLGQINSYVLISENLTAYLTLKGELSGILIKNKEIAEKELFNFNTLWKIAKS